MKRPTLFLTAIIIFVSGIVLGIALLTSAWFFSAAATLVALAALYSVQTRLSLSSSQDIDTETPLHSSDGSQQMALFAELSPFPILRFNCEEEIIMANPAARRILKLDSQPQSPALKQVITAVRKYDLKTCIERGGILSCASTIDDKVFQFVFVGVPERNFGQVYGTDITGLKSAEEKLAESKRFLRKVIDADPHLIFVKDDRGRFTLTNEALAKLYGTSTDAIVGKRDSDFNPMADEVEQFSADDQEVITSLKEKFVEEKVTDSNGNVHWLQTIKRPLELPGSDTVHLLGVATDITKRKELESQLRHSQKMEAIGQLAGGIAHDFNNLLSGVLGYSGLLKINYKNNDDIVHLADKIEQAGLGAQKLTEQLLGFARGGKDQHIPVSLHSTISSSLSLIGRTIEKSIKIVSDFAPEDLYTIGDPVQIQQIILNLAINARDAMTESMGGSDGGTLSIKTEIVELDTPQTAQLRVSPGKYVALSIQDTGCGIEEEVAGRIFDPFFTTKRNDRGTGMGLSMVYGIVSSHGGSVQVESVVGQGSTFRVLLPFIDKPSNEAHTSQIGSSTHGTGKILVVDDHKVTREVTRKMLHKLGYEVVTAKDGLQGFEYYRKHHKSVDLLILDMIMPNMGAHQCFIECKKVNPDVRAILMSGYGRNNAVQNALDEGMLGFLKKPFQFNQLSEAIGQALDAQRAA